MNTVHLGYEIGTGKPIEEGNSEMSKTRVELPPRPKLLVDLDDLLPLEERLAKVERLLVLIGLSVHFGSGNMLDSEAEEELKELASLLGGHYDERRKKAVRLRLKERKAKRAAK